MIKKFSFLILLLFFTANAHSVIIKDIIVDGNFRISEDTIKMFSNVKPGDEINQNYINKTLKDLYETNFFKNVTLTLENDVLKISVEENPIVQNFYINGVKNKSLLENLKESVLIKAKSSFNINLANKDKENILFQLKKNGYYFAKVDIFTNILNDNKIDLTYDISLGEKSRISKIKFIGDKIFKDRKLLNIILTEEYKFWKILSGKKYLNEDLIAFDKRLLKNFYLNKGFYNVDIKSSFARLDKKNQFELIYNITAGQKFFFNDLTLKLPDDYDEDNYNKINDLFSELKGKPYSLFQIENILDEIENITITEQFSSIQASVKENFNSDKINFEFILQELNPSAVKKINILGNNITEESVIRNRLLIDEGDSFNEILLAKSVNNIKALNIFKSVKEEVVDDGYGNEILNIYIEEKPTGEILAGAGYGTSGGSLTFLVKENNFLGKGISFENKMNLTEESIKGSFTINNPNYKNSDNSLYLSLSAEELDLMNTNGYSTDIVSFNVGTDFEYLNDLFLGIQTKNSYESLEVGSKASANQKKQAGNFLDSFLNFNINYDKRNQKFETNDGYISNYSIDLPIISESLTLVNSLSYKTFKELYENNVSTFAFLFKTSNSLNDENVRLSERLFVPGRNLRGFESGKIGPKDGSDFIGGNFISTINVTTTLPKLTENFQNLDLGFFFDAANIWGVDYDSSIDDNGGMRSSVGFGLDVTTPIGPLSFSLATPITKEKTDITESFRFNIGTSF